jgi:hypothetical protein
VTLEYRNSVTIKAKSLAEDVSEQVMTAVRLASDAMEAEAAVMRELEDAHCKLNETIAEIRHAIKAEAVAVTELNQARKREKQALILVNKAARKEEKAEKELKRSDNKLKIKVEMVRKAEESGKRPDVVARDEAIRKAGEAERKASIAHNEGEEARGALALASVELKAARERVMLASARIRTGKRAKEAAIGKVAHTEDDARNAILEARKALEVQAGAKRGMDRTIRGLKAVMQHEAILARTAEETIARNENKLQESEDKTRTAVHRVTKKLKTIIQPEVKIVKVIQAATAITRRGPKNADEIKNALKNQVDISTENVESGTQSEFFFGLVKLVIVGPTNLSRVETIQRRLERDCNCRLKSIGGGTTGEGTSILLQANQPVDLFTRLRELDFVEWVSKKSKDIEVTLKPFNDAAAAPAVNMSPTVVSVSITDRAPGDLSGILSR